MWILGLKGLICLSVTKCFKLSIFTLVEMICQKIWEKSLPKYTKRPLQVDVYRRRRFFIWELQPLPYLNYNCSILCVVEGTG